MKINYSCDCCGEDIDTLEVDELDEDKLGFSCLTVKERESILKYDSLSNSLQVLSLCDQCIEELGLAEEIAPLERGFIH
ncbi:MAG: putative protein family YabK [Firmicutes bacterium]|nr:putative protein family YabK [Bacillota bacterium]